MEKIQRFFKTNIFTINVILIALLVLLSMHVYNLLTALYLTVEFKEMRPLNRNVSVYLRGIKIGKVRKTLLCHDCKSTHVRVMLDYNGLKLPINTTAMLKRERIDGKKIDFIELVYPKEPSQYLLKDGDIISGKATTDIESFLFNQDPDSMEHIKENLESSSENLDNTIVALGDLFVLLQDLIKENQGNIHASGENLLQTTKNIKTISSKFDNALKQKSLDNSVSHTESALFNAKESSANLNKTIENLNSAATSINEAMPMVDSALCQTNGILCNLKEMTCAVKEKMKKPFGTFRLFFGKTIEPQENRGCRR